MESARSLTWLNILTVMKLLRETKTIFAFSMGKNMNNSRRRLVLISISVLGLIAVWLFIPHFRYKAAASKYKLGMSLDEAQLLTGRHYLVGVSTMLYGDGPNPVQQEQDAKYFLSVEHENILLIFNHNKKLIRSQESAWYTKLKIRKALGLKPRDL
jgi:hypothetical protein